MIHIIGIYFVSSNRLACKKIETVAL